MKVLYITTIELNENSGSVEHIRKIVDGLSKENLDIRLVFPAESRKNIIGAIARRKEIAELTKQAIRDYLPDLIYFRYDGAELLTTRELIRRRIPYILELNNKSSNEQFASGRFIGLIATLITQSYVFSHAAAVAVNSKEIYDYFLKFSKRDKPFLIAKNGVDTKEIVFLGYNPSLRSEWDTPVDAPLLTIIGKLDLWHGIDILLDVLNRPELANYYLWIVGNFDHVQDKVLSNHARNRIKLIPWQRKENLSRILSASDIGIGALAMGRKSMSEVQPLKVRTYLAAGLPVFLGYKDPIIPENNSFVYPGIHKSNEEFVSQIMNYYDFVKHHRLELGNKARKFAEENLSWDIAAKETAKFIKLVYEKNKRS